MTDCVETTLRQDLALAAVEPELIRRAWQLYRQGFTPAAISPSQMAAVGEILRCAPGEAEGLGELERWMEAQLRKLEARRERGRRAESWLRPARGVQKAGAEVAGVDESLGRTLLVWLREARFLPKGTSQDLDRWQALRRFWLHLHAFHRYEDEAGEPMPLQALHEEPGNPPLPETPGTPGGTP